MKKYLLVIPILAMLVFAIGCSSDDDNGPVAPAPSGNSYVRVVHLSPDAPAVDVWVDGSRVLQNVAFRGASAYLTVSEGNHRVQISPAGASQPIVLDANVTLMKDASYTIAATGLLANLQATVLTDDRATSSQQAKVRFVHTSPDAPAVDVAVSGGATLFSDVMFREAGVYLNVAPSQYVLDVRIAGSSTLALRVPGVVAGAGGNYTIFAVGLAGNGTLAALALLDAGSPAAISQSELRVGHLSPDAPAVDVWVNQVQVLQNVPFQTLSGYLNVNAGQHWIQITPTGATEPVVIDAVVTLNPNADYTVAATGLIGNNDLQPIVLLDDRMTDPTQAKVRFVHTSPDAPAVDVAVQSGPVLFANVDFREVGSYLSVAAQSYDLEVRLAGTETVALPIPGVAFEMNRNYTVFAIGLAGNGTLAALPVND
ncbi:DUF4397 domain-containing protein [candidate division KSB1 bacterium]|nr:MAG: DUF4397 domain-containing protein [candidate division KSB1 bacterium]